MDLSTLLENIKREADKRQREGADIDTAYHDAITEVIKLTAEQQAVNPFEVRILSVLQEHNGRPVSTTAVAVALGIPSRWTMYNYLSDLEQRGLIVRPLGPRSKSGWALAEGAASQRMTA